MFKEKTSSIRQASLLQCWQVFYDIPPTLWHWCTLHFCSTWNVAAVTLRWFLYTCFSRFPIKHSMKESPQTWGHSLRWGVGGWSSVVFSFLLHNSLCPLSHKGYLFLCNSVGCQSTSSVLSYLTIVFFYFILTVVDWCQGWMSPFEQRDIHNLFSEKFCIEVTDYKLYIVRLLFYFIPLFHHNQRYREAA